MSWRAKEENRTNVLSDMYLKNEKIAIRNVIQFFFLEGKTTKEIREARQKVFLSEKCSQNVMRNPKHFNTTLALKQLQRGSRK